MRELPLELMFNEEAEIEKITRFIKTYLDKFGRSGVILGVSGGVDSGVVLKLLLKAVPKEKILALILPDRDTEKESISLALSLLEENDVSYKIINISPILSKFGIYRELPYWLLPTRKMRENITRKFYNDYTKRFKKSPFFLGLKVPEELLEDKWFLKGIAYHRIKHRIRMVTLYYYAELKNLLVVGTCNKTEKLLGFFVKYGDSAVDLDPIAHLFKTQVFKLAERLGVPDEIINRPPSPDLIPGITDEFAMGMSYEVVDRVLVRLTKGEDPAEIAKIVNLDVEKIKILKEAMEDSLHMRFLPPSLD